MFFSILKTLREKDFPVLKKVVLLIFPKLSQAQLFGGMGKEIAVDYNPSNQQKLTNHVNL